MAERFRELALMRLRKSRCKAKGFSLLEILVAVAVSSIGFLGLAALQASALRNVTVSRRVSVATSLASDRLEIARRGSFADVADAATQTVQADGYSFEISQGVVTLGSGNAKEVTVTVAWNDQFGGHSLVNSSTVSR